MPRARCDEDETTEDEYDKSCLFSKKNHVYFYNPVTMRSVLDLLFEVESIRDEGYETCYIHVNSPGGELMAGLAAYDRIMGLHTDEFQVYGVVEGCAASAATFIILACSYIIMGRNAFFLIHQMSTGTVWGQIRELHDELKNSKKFEDRVRGIYRERTLLTDKDISFLFSKEMYLNADECVVKGIADRLM